MEAAGLVREGTGIVVGVSGGADSVCLLAILKALQSELMLTLTAVHVHHGLRGEEADGDKAFVQALCEKWSIPLRVYDVDVKSISRSKGISLEEAGREVRYDLFAQVLKETGSEFIAVAHQMEDQAETVMLHLLRGTGLDGLCGMSVRQGNLLRPLLNISRAEILEYLTRNAIPYRVDSSNLSGDYTRNRVRNELFPALREMFSVDPVKQLVRLSTLVQDDYIHLEEEARSAFKQCSIEQAPNGSESIVSELSLSKLKSFSDALIKRIIRIAWERIKGNRKNLEQVHVTQVLELIKKEKTGKRVTLPLGARVEISYDKLIFSPCEGSGDKKTYNYSVALEGETRAPKAGGALYGQVMSAEQAFLKYGLPESIKEKELVQLFDYDRIKCGITLRNRTEGDRIYPRGSKGEKKLKEYFIDQKIPREVRSEVPLVAYENRVVWIVGMRTSEDFRAGRDTRRVCVLSWRHLDGGEQKWQK